MQYLGDLPSFASLVPGRIKMFKKFDFSTDVHLDQLMVTKIKTLFTYVAVLLGLSIVRQLLKSVFCTSISVVKLEQLL